MAGVHGRQVESHVYQWRTILPPLQISYRWIYRVIYQSAPYPIWIVESIISIRRRPMGWIWRRCKLWCQLLCYQLYPIRRFPQVHPIVSRTQGPQSQLCRWCGLHQECYWRLCILRYPWNLQPVIWQLLQLLYISRSSSFWPQLYICYNTSLNLQLLFYRCNRTYHLHHSFSFPLLHQWSTRTQPPCWCQETVQVLPLQS